MFTILREYTDLVEPVSIDEGYMDMTDTPYSGNALETAKEIQSRLQKESAASVKHRNRAE